MNTANYFKLLAIATKLATTFGIVNYSLNLKTRQFVPVPGLQSRVYFTTIILFANTMFWLGSTIRILRWGAGYADPEFYIVYIFTIGSVMAYGAILTMNWKKDDVAFAANQLILHMIKFKGLGFKLVKMSQLI